MSKPSIGIVIPTFGRPDMLKRCLESIPKDYSISVFDDASPQRDEIEALARDRGAKFFSSKENRGFPANSNRGVQRTSTELILLLNSDVLLYPSTIDIMMAEFDDPKMGVVAPMLTFPPDSEWGTPGMIQHVGMAVNVVGHLVHLFIGWSPNNPRAVQRRETLNFVTGACMMFRRNAWMRVGGFFEGYGRGTYEDAELCMRIKQGLGLKIVVEPRALGMHYVGQSVKSNGGYPIGRNYEIFRGRVGAYLKNDDYLYL